ncbi:MAG: SLOG family protein [Oscillospiraceae bacterium]|nr:SLOG family protein [Oscillospiraceae bacterium]
MKNKTIFTTCCFTGHRPQSLPWGSNEQDPRCVRLKALLREEIRRLITENGVTHFISGMAVGTDLMAAQTVLELKREYPHITLESAIPHENQADRWTAEQRETYYDIARQCDTETMLQRAYSPDCFQKRNQYMISRSAFVIAVWNGAPSGTGQTVMLAREKKRNLTIINPGTLEITSVL